MKYLEMVIKESLRLYTIVLAMHRLPEEDITIEVCSPTEIKLELNENFCNPSTELKH